MKEQSRGQWGIATQHGWWEWEETLLANAKPPSPQASENTQTREVLLVDKSGRPLLVKGARPVGFRPR